MEKNKSWKAKTIVSSCIAAIIVIALTAPMASAIPFPVQVKGFITYTDGTLVPDGWTVSLENLDEVYADEPWTTTTQAGVIDSYNYLVVGTADALSTFRIDVSDPTGTYTASETFTAVGLDTKIVNITIGILSVTVEYPKGGEEIPIGDVVEVSASASDDTEVVSVDFSYSADNGTTWNTIEAGTLVSGDITSGTWNASWDTAGLPVGDEYLIKAVATDNEANTAEDTSDSTFSLADKGKPLFRNAKAEPSIILVGETTEVTFSIDAADKESEVSEARVYYGATLIGTMSLVGNYTEDSLTWGMYEYKYNMTPPAETTYDFSLVPLDIYENYNTTTVSVDAVSWITHNVTIYEGWNLISVPLTPTNTSIDAVIPVGQAADGDWIYVDKPGGGLSWDYAYYSNGWKGTLTTIEPEMGYLYNRVGSGFNISVTGTPLTAVNTTIYNGWNLLGYAKTDIADLTIINDPYDGDWIYADKLGPDLSWDYAYYSGGWKGTLTNFTAGEGYLYNRAGDTFHWVY